MISDRDKCVLAFSSLGLFLTETGAYVKGTRTSGCSLWLLFLDLLRQTPFVHDAQLAVYLPPVADGHRPSLRSFKSGQIQCFQQGSIAWKYAPLTLYFF